MFLYVKKLADMYQESLNIWYQELRLFFPGGSAMAPGLRQPGPAATAALREEAAALAGAEVDARAGVAELRAPSGLKLLPICHQRGPSHDLVCLVHFL